MLTIFIFLYGLIFGSFFNVVGLRVPKNESMIKPRSQCPNCKHTLMAVELIPIISYIVQKGSCKQCGERISPLYPAMELATGLLFAFTYIKFGISLDSLIGILFVSLLVIIFVTDIKYMLIPDKILMSFTPLFVMIRIVSPTEPWWDAWVGSLLGFTLLLLIAIISKGGIGGGDIKLFAVIGFVLGWKGVLLTLFISSLVGTVIGIFGLLLKKVSRKQQIPFGPFIVFGALITFYWGERILEWYLG